MESDNENNLSNVFTEDQVISLCDFIDEHINLEFDELTGMINSKCEHTFKWTKEWILINGLIEESILDFCQKWGGCCDCEVLLNVPNSYDI